jgi:hypothetical protein
MFGREFIKRLKREAVEIVEQTSWFLMEEEGPLMMDKNQHVRYIRLG